MSNTLSTVTVQQIVDVAKAFGEIDPILNVGGQSQSPALAIATDVMNAIYAVPFPHKWNEIETPQFYSNSYQQDYAAVYPVGLSGNLVLSAVAAASYGLAVYTGVIIGGDNNAFVGVPFVVTGFIASTGINNGTFQCAASTATTLTLKNAAAVVESHVGQATSAATSLLNLSWLQRGVAFDINNTAIPKPWANVEVGRSLPQRTASYLGALYNMEFTVNWQHNRMLYYGTWGGGNTNSPTTGNNPAAGSVYTSPLGSKAQPNNPITQVQDANGNLLLLTTYGTEGTTAPLAAVGACPGTTVAGSGATTVWTVLDPIGWGFRVLPIFGQTGTEWQFNLVGQMKPPRFVSLSQTLDPLPDEFEPHFRAGFVAQCYRYSPEAKVSAKFPREWQLWLQSLGSLRAKEDRELEEYRFVPARTIMGGGRARNQWVGAAWPFNYPRP